MTNKLTPKQEKFCQLIFEGKTQTEAYRGAFDCAKMKPETVNNSAYKLLQLPHIAARIAELRAKLTEKTLWDFEQAAKVRLEIIYRGKGKNKGEEPASDSDRLKAADALDKLHGIEPAKKIDVTIKDHVHKVIFEVV